MARLELERLSATISLLTLAALAAALVLLMLPAPAEAQTFSLLHTFIGGADGSQPQAGLTMDRFGNLYGTTSTAGAGYGTVFKLTHSGSGWVESTLYTFQGGVDGAMPLARVVFGPDGTLYGTTIYGGSGGGTVFNLRPPATFCRSILCPWTKTVLYRFMGGTDGSEPEYGDLTFDAAGNIYGTASRGGTGCSPYGGCGVVFKLSRSGGGWTESVLFAFAHGVGQTPTSGVIFDSAGNLYGTLLYGGTNGRGMVYELTPSGSGWTQAPLYSFGVWPAGGNPYGGLVFDQQGNLYGTTFNGGDGGGTVYELQPMGGNWTFTTLYSLPVSQGPFDGPTIDSSGNLYATTEGGGVNSIGNVFELSPGADGWTYSDLHDFNYQHLEQGFYPIGGVVLDAHGNLYGTTASGGNMGPNCGEGCGVVWEITP